MTEDANKLADAIDPRLQPPETVTGGMSWVLQTKDLIAASNFIRSHSPSSSAEEVRTLSTRLSGVSVSDSTKALMELCREAGDMLTRLSTQEAVDAAYERAARYHDQAEADTAAEHPGVQGSKSQKRLEKFHRESATAIRALKGKPA